jgi:thioredoxin 1
MKAAAFTLLALLIAVSACSRQTSPSGNNGGMFKDGDLILTDANFDQEVAQSTEPVLVDFSATWCGPCRLLAPTVDALASEYHGRVKVGKVDIDQNPAVTEKYGISSIPALLVFKNGEVVDRVIGVQSKENLASMLNDALQTK